MLAQRPAVGLVPRQRGSTRRCDRQHRRVALALVVRAQVLEHLALLVACPDRRVVRAAPLLAVSRASVRRALAVRPPPARLGTSAHVPPFWLPRWSGTPAR